MWSIIVYNVIVYGLFSVCSAFSSYWDVDLTPVLTFLGEGSVVKQGKVRRTRLKGSFVLIEHIYIVLYLIVMTLGNLFLNLWHDSVGK